MEIKTFLIIGGLQFFSYAAKSQAQQPPDIHLDTIKVVQDTVTRGEGLNGKLIGYRTFVGDRKSYQPKAGYNKIFRADGKMYLEGEYILIDSTYRRTGLFKFYNVKGILDYTQDFNSSLRVYYFGNGRKKSQGPVNNLGERTGLWTCYYPSGLVKSQGELKGELKKGTWKYFDEKGKLTNKVKYKAWTGSSESKDCCDWK
jgi:antitoxin component YwqK of YwqJK toxin-antitoxin module